jgi:GAF domain-containing protein
MATRFADLGWDLFGTHDVRLALQRLVHSAQRIISGVDFVSITVAAGGSYATPAYTDGAAVELDLVQYAADDGPCVDATRIPGLGLTYCENLGVDPPWKKFAERAIELDVHSVLSVGLFPTAEAPRIGALNFYARTPGALDSVDRDIAVILAAYAGTALAAVSALETAEQHAEHLQQALQTRDVIGQAKGILMTRRGLTAEEAFRVISESSQRLNIKVRDLAREITADPDLPLPA